MDRGGVTWGEVEGWLAEGSGCLWEINGGQAYVLTVATETEIEGVLAGGEGAREWARAQGAATVDYRAQGVGPPLARMGTRGLRR